MYDRCILYIKEGGNFPFFHISSKYSVNIHKQHILSIHPSKCVYTTHESSFWYVAAAVLTMMKRIGFYILIYNVKGKGKTRKIILARTLQRWYASPFTNSIYSSMVTYNVIQIHVSNQTKLKKCSSALLRCYTMIVMTPAAT